MTDIQLFEKLIALPSELKKEVSDFVDFLNMKSKKSDASFSSERIPGKAKGMINIKDDFDDPISYY